MKLKVFLSKVSQPLNFITSIIKKLKIMKVKEPLMDFMTF